MDIGEAIARIEKASRERDALEGYYEDLRANLDAQADASDVPSRDLMLQLANAIDMERQQSANLWLLLEDAYVRLGDALHIPLPPGFMMRHDQ